MIGRTQANVTLLRVILTESGVDPDKVAVTQFGTSQIAEMTTRSGHRCVHGGGPARQQGITAAEAIASDRAAPGASRCFCRSTYRKPSPSGIRSMREQEIPGSSFSSSPRRGPEDKVETVSVNHLIVARKALSETAVGTLARQLFAARRRWPEVPGAAHIEKPDTDKERRPARASGAAAYIDGTERTFLERYSDYFWAALLVLSGLGSGRWPGCGTI